MSNAVKHTDKRIDPDVPYELSDIVSVTMSNGNYKETLLYKALNLVSKYSIYQQRRSTLAQQRVVGSRERHVYLIEFEHTREILVVVWSSAICGSLNLTKAFMVSPEIGETMFTVLSKENTELFDHGWCDYFDLSTSPSEELSIVHVEM